MEQKYNDKNCNILFLKQVMEKFVKEREWEKYHIPKNLSQSIAIEAAELMECFQWDNPKPCQIQGNKKQHVKEEMADILAYLLSLANVLQIDLTDAFLEKMDKNRKKYPVEYFKGKYEKV